MKNQNRKNQDSKNQNMKDQRKEFRRGEGQNRNGKRESLSSILQVLIRPERETDYHETEHMVMRAFWNLHGPGCNEHLMVHKLRVSEDYVPELSRVAELDGKVVGAIFYSKAWIERDGRREEILTFGPLCADPLYQGRGICGRLLEETIALAKEAGYRGICIWGESEYYLRHGFRTTEAFGITGPDGSYSPALMGYELHEGGLSGIPEDFTLKCGSVTLCSREDFPKVPGVFRESPVFETCDDKAELEAWNRQFPAYPKLKLSCQWLHKERLGRICEVQKDSFVIRYWEKELRAELCGQFYKERTDQEMEFPIVGDYVTFQYRPQGVVRIMTVCERTGLLLRPNPAKGMSDQKMAANVDEAFLITSLNDDFSINRLARFAAAAGQGGAKPVAVLTKCDLCEDTEERIAAVCRMLPEIPVYAVSSLTGDGMDALRKRLECGKTIALLGSSGVGKSALVNALSGTERMETGAVREKDSKGRHTTTYRRMFELPGGVTMIDMPGMREFGVCDAEEGIDDTFADIAALREGCRFRDCRHESEPGCAIQAALADGTLSVERWKLYQSLQKESKKSADWKAISKTRKARNRLKNRSHQDDWQL